MRPMANQIRIQIVPSVDRPSVSRSKVKYAQEHQEKAPFDESKGV